MCKVRRIRSHNIMRLRNTDVLPSFHLFKARYSIKKFFRSRYKAMLYPGTVTKILIATHVTS
jgi:hypothetical protein